MKNKLFFICLLIIYFSLSCYAQLSKKILSDTISITTEDMLDLRLQVLAAQISSGSYKIYDLGRFSFPVSIRLDNKSKISFEIEGEIKQNLSQEKKNEIVTESMEYIVIAISEMIRVSFPKINFEKNKDVIGYWYFKNGNVPRVKMENGKITWIEY